MVDALKVIFPSAAAYSLRPCGAPPSRMEVSPAPIIKRGGPQNGGVGFTHCTSFKLSLFRLVSQHAPYLDLTAILVIQFNTESFSARFHNLIVINEQMAVLVNPHTVIAS